MRRGLAVAALSCGLVAGGCSGGEDGDEPRKESLAPQFLPEVASDAAGGSTTTAATGSAGATSTSPTSPGSGTAGGAAGPPTSGPPSARGDATVEPGSTAIPTTQASITDKAGDVTASPLDRPPAWSDLLSARLTRSAAGFELRVRLGGGAAPQQTPDEEHTMNIATFYDLDGDGRIDTEVWLNVAAGGWGATWFDNVGDGGGFQEGSGVTVTPEGDEVVARFPLTHLEGTDRFRWAVASEWGRYETIGTVAAARDDLPDNDNIAGFPSS